MCDLKTELDKYASHILFLFHKDSRILRSSSYPDKGITQQPHQYQTRQEITLPQLAFHNIRLYTAFYLKQNIPW